MERRGRRGALLPAGVAVIVTTIAVAVAGLVPARHTTQGAASPAVVRLLSTASTTVQRHAKGEPSAHQWFRTEVTYSEYDQKTRTEVDWVRFDGQQTAYFQSGRLVVNNVRGVTPTGSTPLARFEDVSTPKTTYEALASLPTDPKRLLGVVRERALAIIKSGRPTLGVPEPATDGQAEFAYLVLLLWNADEGAPPSAEGAAYRAMTLIPGVTVNPGMLDVTGKKTIALSDGTSTQLLLDPITYQPAGFLLLSDGSADGAHAPSKGQVMSSQAFSAKPVDGPGDD